MIALCFFVLTMILPFSIHAQRVEQFSIDEGLTVGGGVNISNVFYSSSGEQVREPYNVVLSGNLNLNLFGYDLPFSFSWSNSQRSYTQPFNRLSLTPSYKWARAYLGYTSMTFSPLTLAGHGFLGAGVELSPGNWRFAAMTGRLNKAAEYGNPNQQPAYRRMGHAIKVGYEQGANALSVAVFTARDDENSIQPLPADFALQPQSNIAASISGRAMLFSFITLDAEYSLSALNANVNADSETDSSEDLPFASPLSDENVTTRVFDAINTGIGYNAPFWGVQFRYERVAPDYRTLGGYYFNNDMENYTIAPNLRLLEGKLTLAGNVGIQRNNLNGELETTDKRFAGAGTVSVALIEGLNLSASYSNFNAYTSNRPKADPFSTNPMDSLDFYQISNNINGMASYSFGDSEKTRSVMVNAGYQKVSNTSNREGGGELSDFIMGNIGYTHGFPSDIVLTAGVNANINNAAQMQSIYWGPAIGANKPFLEKRLRAGLNCAYNQSILDGKADAPVLSTGVNASWTPQSQENKTGNHNVNMNMSWIQRFQSETRPAKNEFMATLNYGYSF